MELFCLLLTACLNELLTDQWEALSVLLRYVCDTTYFYAFTAATETFRGFGNQRSIHARFSEPCAVNVDQTCAHHMDWLNEPLNPWTGAPIRMSVYWLAWRPHVTPIFLTCVSVWSAFLVMVSIPKFTSSVCECLCVFLFVCVSVRVSSKNMTLDLLLS